MEKVTKIRVKKPDGSFTDPVPIGAKANDVTMSDGTALEPIFRALRNNVNQNNTKIDGLQINFSDLDAQSTNLSLELKTAKQQLLTKVDGARVDDQGFLYLLSGEQTIVGPLGPFNGTGGGSGGGGGGGQTNNAVISLNNTSGWIAKSISSGSECNISCTWSSIEEETPTGEGIVNVYINGINRQTIGVDQGDFTVRVGTLLTLGKNSVRVTVTDVYGNNRSINYTVTVVNAVISSSFNTNLPFDGDILFSYVPQGDLVKIVHFILDGNELDTQEVSTSGRQITYTIPAQEYGTHSLEVYFVADMDGIEIESNHLYYEFAAVDEDHNDPIITSNFSLTEVEQYTTLAIPYRVYTPTSLNSSVVLKIEKQLENSKQTIFTTTIMVDRSQQIWSYRCDNDGTLIFTIASEEVFKEFTIEVIQSSANIYAETQNLALHLTSNNRNNGEVDPAIWTYEDISATFSNFNFVTDGWQLDNENNTVLRLAGDARVTIPYKIFQSDFKTTGKTIEIEFATKQVADFSTNILSCYSDGMGILITPQQITFKGAQTEINTLYKENEHVRLSIVVGKQSNYRLILIYINGIMSRAIQYASGERFSQLNPVGITIGSNDCDIDIYNIRVYDNDLTRTQILGNWIADTQNSDLKIARYNYNNVYDEYDQIAMSKLKNLPYMIIDAASLPEYKGDKKICSGIYTDPKDAKNSFTFEGCQIDVQGTSSSVYFRKNWDLQFKQGFSTSSGIINKYPLRNGSIPFNRFVLKADVASSQSTNNTGLTMFYNDTCPYKTPEMIQNPKVRWGIEGIPIVLYWHNTVTDEIEFLGKHNFNLPKRAPDPYGYGNDNTLESWEVERNNSDNVKFKDNDFETMSWDETEQKFFPEWYNDFEARFPSDEWRDISKLNELVSWIKSTYRDAATGQNLPTPVTYTLNTKITVNNYSDDQSYTVVEEMNGGIRTGNYIFTFTKDTPAYRLTKFKAELPDYFEMDSAIFYYLFTEMFTMIDSRAKNMFIGFNGGPVTQEGRAMDRKATCQPYDMDTAVGTNNSGVLMFGFFYEDGDHVSSIISGGDEGGSEAPVFNAQDSVLWSNVRDSCRSELVAMYRSLRASGAWSYDVVETMYENHQSAWCEAIFNEDAYVKYLYPLVEAVTVDEDTGRLIRTDRYLTMLQGSKAEQRKWWLYNRFRYMDSKFSTGNASSATLDIRLFNSGTLNITPVNDIYVGVAFGLGSTPQLKRTLAGETATFTYTAPSGVTQMETSIFSGDMITDLGDLSVFYPNEINFAKGTRLKHLKIGDSNSNYSNRNLRVLDVSNSPLLEDIDCRNCPTLTSTINLENSPRLIEAYFDGTSITGVSLADGCTIETLHLPDTIATLILVNLNKLTDLTIAGYENISRLMLDNINPNLIDPVTMIQTIQPHSQVNIQGLQLEMNTAEEIRSFLNILDTMQGVTREKNSNGEWLYYEYDKAQVSGTIHTNSLTGAEVNEFNRYPYLRVYADHTTSYLTYKTYDGSSTVGELVQCIDGVPQSSPPAVPARSDSADGHYSYTGIGWNTSQDSQTNDPNAIINVIADRTVYAAYTWNVKKYTVTWKNSDNTTLETDNNVAWGSTPTYNGSTPVDPSGNNSPFVAWTPAVSSVTGNITYTASFKPIWTVNFYNQSGTTLLQTKNVIDGNTASYTGSTPTNTDETTFLGWATTIDANDANAVLTNIKENKNFYAAHEALIQDIEITDTWDQIIQHIDTGDYATRYKLGNYKPLDLGSTYGTVNMQIVAFDTDMSTNNSQVPITFITKELLPSQPMNTFSSIEGGWATMSLRAWLMSTIKPLIPSNITVRINSVNKTYRNKPNDNIETCVDTLWIPSMREIQGDINPETSGIIYNKFFKNDNSRIKKYNGTAQWYWTRSAFKGTIQNDTYNVFNEINEAGNARNGNRVTVSQHFCFGFCLGLEPETITDSWQTILSNPNYATDYSVGDTKYLDLGVEGNQLMQIVGIDVDDRADGNGKAGITWLSKNLLNESHRMNPALSGSTGSHTEGTGSIGGWPVCEMRTYLKNTIKQLIPSNVRLMIADVIKYSTIYNSNDEKVNNVTSVDDLWIPSFKELHGSNTFETEGPQYTLSKRAKTSLNRSITLWSLRSSDFTPSFYSIRQDGQGNQSYHPAQNSTGICLGFCTN